MFRFLPKSKRARTALAVGASLVAVAVVAALLASTADSGSPAKKHLTVKNPAATTKPLKLVIGAVTVQSAGPPAKVTIPARQALMRATQQYFDDAVQAPLRHRPVNVAYLKLFDPGVKGPAAGKDRDALTEVATGRIIGAAKTSATPVRIDGLGDPTGKLALVATTFTLNASANTPVGRVTISRHTELTFANEFGRWLVTAYRVRVRRTLGPKTTTTLAHAGTTA